MSENQNGLHPCPCCGKPTPGHVQFRCVGCQPQVFSNAKQCDPRFTDHPEVEK